MKSLYDHKGNKIMFTEHGKITQLAGTQGLIVPKQLYDEGKHLVKAEGKKSWSVNSFQIVAYPLITIIKDKSGKVLDSEVSIRAFIERKGLYAIYHIGTVIAKDMIEGIERKIWEYLYEQVSEFVKKDLTNYIKK